MNNDCLAFFLTWTTYGTFLPGDLRGWTKWHKGEQQPQPLLNDWCKEQMTGAEVRLSSAQRRIVEEVIGEHCRHRGWILHGVNCRSNHCHVVVAAIEHSGDQVRDQLKAWATRRLNDDVRSKRQHATQRWWTRKGSVRHLYEENALDLAIEYTLEAQSWVDQS